MQFALALEIHSRKPDCTFRRTALFFPRRRSKNEQTENAAWQNPAAMFGLATPEAATDEFREVDLLDKGIK